MGGKSLVLLGVIASGLYTYFCINTHKDQLYTKLYPSSTTPVAEEKVVANNNLEEVEVTSEGSADFDAQKVVVALEDATRSRSEKEELQSNEEVLHQLEASTQKKVAVVKDDASFYFVNESPYIFNALLAENRTESEMIKEINQFCQTKECASDIQFLDSVKEESWSKDALNIVHYLADNNIEKGSLSIKDGVLKVTGELKDAQAKEGIQNLLNAFGDTMNIQNETRIAEVEEVVVPTETVEVEEIVVPAETVEVEEVVAPAETVEVEEVVAPAETVEVEEVVVPTETVEVKEKEISVEDKIRQAQSEINILLQNAVINFKVNSSEIVPASREILDRIILIVNRLDISVNADVLGHTDASGSKSYNKKLSQKRAASVKKYLLNNGMKISTLTAIGHGEENLIFDPYDKRNRRVEIYLTKGE